MLRLRLGGAQGFYFKLSDQTSIVARLARGDVNMPNYDGFPLDVQVPEVKFEVAAYELLRSEPNILASRLLYHRIPVQHAGPRLVLPQDIAGRRIFLFERAEGENNVWADLSPAGKVRAFVGHLLRLNQSKCVNIIVCRPSSSVGLYSCITVQLQSATRLRHRLAPRTPL